MAVRGFLEEVQKAVLSWTGMTAHPHRFGGVEFRLGQREIGHIHGDWLLDIPFPTKVRQELVVAGLAEPHHVLPESGWVSFFPKQASDVEHAIALMRRSYDLALRQKNRKEERA